MHKASAMTLMLIVATTLLVSCSNEPDPESSVELKRGVRLRVITSLDEIKAAKLGTKGMPAFPISGDSAWFSSVPAKDCDLTIEGRPATKLNLAPNYSYTVFVTREGVETYRAPDSSEPKTAPTLSVLNATRGSVTVNQPGGFGAVEASNQSAAMSITVDASVVLSVGTSTLKGSIKTVPDGQYTAVVYMANGQAQLKVLHDNPPMNVAGASNRG